MAKNVGEVEKQCREFRKMFDSLRTEVAKVIVGHEDIVENVLICIFCGGHVLLVRGSGHELLPVLGDVRRHGVEVLQHTG